MGRRGPKPKPASVLALTGSRSTDKRARRLAAQLVRAMPDPPPYLSDDAKPHFDRLGALVVGIGAIAEVDGDLLATTCEALVDYLRARDQIRREGETYLCETESGASMMRPHPLLGERTKLWNSVTRGLGALGLTPSGREGREPLPDEIMGGEDKDGGVRLSV